LIPLLAAGLLGLHPLPAAGDVPAPPQPLVLHADPAGVVLEWRAPDFWLRPVSGDDGRPYSAVETPPGWMQTEEPGRPQLPIASALALVPPTGDVTLRVETLERARRPLPHPVAPARAPLPVGDPPTRLEWVWARDEGAYAATGPQPADAVALEEAGWWRDRHAGRGGGPPGGGIGPAGDGIGGEGSKPGAVKTAEFDYELPPQLIAHTPLEPRHGSRLTVVDRRGGEIAHR
jgi:hypothetical protein